MVRTWYGPGREQNTGFSLPDYFFTSGEVGKKLDPGKSMVVKKKRFFEEGVFFVRGNMLLLEKGKTIRYFQPKR